MLNITDEKATQLLEKLESLCSDYELKVSDDQLSKCLEHFDLVIEANKSVNLTRILDLDEGVVLHIFDSLVLLPYLGKAPKGALLDMGTGAGFPGIPLTIVSGRSAAYIDSVGKKVNAVNGFVEALALKHAHAVHARLEEYASTHKKQFAVVTARALAPLDVLVEYASPYLMDGGLLVVTKGNPSNEEIERGFKAAKICGFSLVGEDSLDLPDGLGHREFLIFKKTRSAAVALPRANGMAKKNPLA